MSALVRRQSAGHAALADKIPTLRATKDWTPDVSQHEATMRAL
jgi:hypothetical protein